MQNNIKVLIAIIFTFLISAGILFVISRDENVVDETKDRILEISDIYNYLESGDIEKASEITPYLPRLNETNIFLVPIKVNQKLETESFQDVEISESEINEFENEVKELTNVLNTQELDIFEKSVVYHDLILNSSITEEHVLNFIESFSQNSFPYSIIRLEDSEFDINNYNQFREIYLTHTSQSTKSDWKDIENLNIFEINENKVGVVYTLNDSFGYEVAIILDIFEYVDDLLLPPQRRIIDFSSISSENYQIQIDAMIGEVIENEN